MAERRLAFRQCDVERAIKAAQQTGAARVIVRRDGSLAIELTGDAADGELVSTNGPAVRRKEIVL